MGYSTIAYSAMKGLLESKDGETIEASDSIDFISRGWESNVKACNKGDNKRYYFTLNNDDFVTVEVK